ncbi:MAG: alpha/beta hydrolase [Steroidobacteraceae bacterium]
MSATVILVHGLWMSGFELTVLRRRLQAAKMQTAAFSYPSMTRPMNAHARALLEFARAQQCDQLHFVGHSLGGIVILRALELDGANSLPPGRAVLLGSPLQGSCAARGITKLLPFGRAILGMSINEECIEHCPRTWAGQRDVGVIAGSSGLGLGRLFATMEGEHDGTVLVSETQLPGAKDHLVLPASHSSMVFSSAVANQTVHFLTHGAFLRTAQASHVTAPAP